MTAGQLPEGRYGPRASARRARWLGRWGGGSRVTGSRVTGSRVLRSLVTVLGALFGLAVAVIGYRNLAETPVQGQALGFELLTGDPATHAVSLRLQVVREDPARPAVCIVRARSLDGDETGRKEVYVPPDVGPVDLTTVIHTSRPPVTADVYGCSLQVPAYLVPASGS